MKPPVTTSASGDGTTPSPMTALYRQRHDQGCQGTAAHIHTGAAGKNGPVIVPFTKEGDTYKAPAGAKLNADQMTAFKAGELYSTCTAANPGGEIRGQLK
jgi:hypothetical protein